MQALFRRQRCAAAALLAAMFSVASAQDAERMNPVTKVVSLLTEMKAQVEKEAKDDQQAYEKYECWCTTNRDKKTEAVETATKRIDALAAFLEEAAGMQAQLKTEIEALEKAIVEDQDALSTATSLRMKEQEEFYASEKDAKETIDTMKQALVVLEKVQLIQKKKGRNAEAEVRPLLLQVKTAVEGVNGKLAMFKGVMQRDLWDVMSTMDDAVAPDSSSDFLAARAGRRMSALEQRGALSAGQAPMTGAAAGASSYSARSSSIYGMLSTMKEEFEKGLAEDQKADLEAEVAYQKLRAAKLGEISAGQLSHGEKQAALADSEAKAAQAKEDIETTREALGADQKFLVGLEQNCKENVDGYEARSKARNDELLALAEAVQILTEDDARDLFIKHMSFLQLDSTLAGGSATETSMTKAKDQAMKRILNVARKQKNWVFASLAVRVRLDSFEKVKEAMDKMTAELKAQQKAEFLKKDHCNKAIDEHEDSIKTKQQEKSDLEGSKLGLENEIEALSNDIETLKGEVADMQTALKEAGEDRKGENMVFQQAVSDQRATQNILEKAKARLAKFYMSKDTRTALAQVGQEPEPVDASVPGAAVEAPPPMSKDYSKSAGAGGVIQLLDKIMADAAREEQELVTTESHAQKSYESMVKDINEGLKADETAIVEKTKLMEEASADKSEHEASLSVNAEEISKLGETLSATHLDCDFLLKFFDVRQKAREEELNAIAEAKAILSGADFGKAEEPAPEEA